MASPQKISSLEGILVVRLKAQAQVAAPGAVPGTVETEVSLPESVPYNAAISCGYIGTTPAARSANHQLHAVIKHNDPKKLLFRWTQTAGATAAVPAGDYVFVISW